MISWETRSKLLAFADEMLDERGDKQLIKAVEELNELQDELLKYLDGRGDRAKLVEEFSDVIVIMWQLKLRFGIDRPEIKDWIDYKVERTRERLGPLA